MTSSSKSIALDSNILIHGFNQNSPHHSRAMDILVQAKEKSINACIAPQNAFELYTVITRTKPIATPAKEAQEIMLDYLFSKAFTIVIPNSQTLFALAEILTQITLKKGTHIYDLFLAATLISNGIKTLYTQNTKDFANIPNLTAQNPFT